MKTQKQAVKMTKFEVYHNGQYAGFFPTIEDARRAVESNKQHVIDCAENGWIPAFKKEDYYWDIRDYKNRYFERITF